jgi:hypothetical protein
MRGREFIALLGGTWPFAERAQTPARSEVAHLTNASRGCS